MMRDLLPLVPVLLGQLFPGSRAGATGATGPGGGPTGATGPSGPTGATGAGSYTAATGAASSGAITLNAACGTITDTTSSASYTLTLTNSFIDASSVVLFNAYDSAGTIWGVTANTPTGGAVSATFASLSSAASVTLHIKFAVFG